MTNDIKDISTLFGSMVFNESVMRSRLPRASTRR